VVSLQQDKPIDVIARGEYQQGRRSARRARNGELQLSLVPLDVSPVAVKGIAPDRTSTRTLPGERWGTGFWDRYDHSSPEGA
jgi:hypothetical protein